MPQESVLEGMVFFSEIRWRGNKDRIDNIRNELNKIIWQKLSEG
jgi:hypothetical protein